MRLVTFEHGGRQRAGALRGDRIIDLRRAEPELPATVLELIQGGPAVLDWLRQTVDRAAIETTLPMSEVRLLAPIPRPPKVLCIGLNYANHVKEAEHMGLKWPNKPSVFMKASSCVVGPRDPIPMPPTTQQLDYEVELTIVIGARAKGVSRADALGAVAGYTVANDVSARDLQFSPDGGIIMGKNFDGSAPMGPCITLTDEIPDPGTLRVRTWVNGEQRQDSNTNDLIFDVPAMIEYLSQALTLEPGDVILTGTPAGVGLGMRPQVWLQQGDVVRMEIERIGVIENRVE
jgi:acylpyruvate hydrolase